MKYCELCNIQHTDIEEIRIINRCFGTNFLRVMALSHNNFVSFRYLAKSLGILMTFCTLVQSYTFLLEIVARYL